MGWPPPLPLLELLENVSHPSQLSALRRWFATDARNFRVFLDDACALPSDWRQTWDQPRQWGLTGAKNWPTKYAAAGFIPRMIEHSPFVTADWRSASASVVVLFARQFAGGPAIMQQQCLQRLAARSAAFRANNGSRHFFIFTDSRGPCCLDGKYKDVDFLRHHVIGPHGEPDSSWFFRRGRGPRIRCFDAAKDVNIPTPNIHFPRTPLAPRLSPVPPPGSAPDGQRSLLLFYAGWNYGVRMELVELYRNDAEVFVRQKVAPSEYVTRMLSAKFCPVCGGFSQWTPRLAEALYYECVPVILSPQMLPPFSGLLDWSTFSVRLEPTKRNLASLKQTLKAVDHAKLLRGVRAARSALQYHLGGWTGRDMLPLLLYEMARVAATPVAPPPGAPVVALYNDVETARDYDVGMHDVASQKAHAIVTRAGVQHGPDVWDCRSDDGYMCACKRRLPGAAPPLSLPAPARWPPKAVLPAAAVSAAAPAAPVPPPSCPVSADLEDPAALDAMLAARASTERDVVIMILGPTSGLRAVRMGALGEAMLRNMVANLRAVGVHSYLAITTHLHLPAHPSNNLCVSRLRPAGICCGYAGVGMRHVAADAPGRNWTVEETHPYMLFLQRWWFTAQAVARGYNVLSIDTDMHLASNPLDLVRRPSYAAFDALMQLDSAWPVEGSAEGQRPTDERGQHVNVLPCLRGAVSEGLGRARSAEWTDTAGLAETEVLHGCGCGVTPAPLLNTGFVYVRASAAPVGAQQRVFSRSVDKILQRLQGPPARTPTGAVDPHAVWAQDVVNEATEEMAELPVGWPRSCHRKDTACATRALGAQDAKDAKRRWWLRRRRTSAWLASRPVSPQDVAERAARNRGAASCEDAPPRSPEQQLVAWTELHAPAPASGALPPPPRTLAALPRVAVGRMCGARIAVQPRWLHVAAPLPCSALSAAAALGQEVGHMQFTSAETRVGILEAMGWWHEAVREPPKRARKRPPPTLTCREIAGAETPLAGVVVSSAMANKSLLCVLPGVREGQPHVALAPGACPCCWSVEALQAGATTADAKAVRKAGRYTGCRIWRRFA